jgi:hypothetical protein
MAEDKVVLNPEIERMFKAGRSFRYAQISPSPIRKISYFWR